MKQVLVSVSNQSEMVRLAPVIRTLRDDFSDVVCTRWVRTGSNPDKVWQTGALFGLSPDREFDLRCGSSNLVEHSWEIANSMGREFDSTVPDLLVIQGESLSSLLASQQAFMRRIPVVVLPNPLKPTVLPVEPHLDSYRRLISAVANFRCLTNERDLGLLKATGIPSIEMAVTGDTVVDALAMVLKHGILDRENPSLKKIVSLDNAQIVVALSSSTKRMGAMTELAIAIAEISRQYPGILFTVLTTPDSQIRGLLHSVLDSIQNVTLREPVPFYEFLRVLQLHDLVITDSEDLHAEATALGKPGFVLVDLDFSLKPDGIFDTQYVTWEQEHLCHEILGLLADNDMYRMNIPDSHCLGDGKAAKRIGCLIAHWARNNSLSSRAFEPYRGIPPIRRIPDNLHAV
ncbi:MAG: UDP-N-acetyl glucosamine 2-epimerase [Burkholderiaceae bacterium]|nr:UDP-N-acetyl glucosamine 2-epimerase [Burkholderiaceae bacterium]